MPVGISPMVIYYNTDLVDFSRMALRGISAPVEAVNWNFDQFLASAEFASRPRRGTRGIARRPDAHRALAVHLRRGRRGVRRRRAADLAGLLRRRHPHRARDRAAGAPRPAAHAEREAARPAPPDGVVHARQAGDDPRLPRAGADAARRPGAGVRRDADPRHRAQRDRRQLHRHVRLRRHPQPHRRGRLPGPHDLAGRRPGAWSPAATWSPPTSRSRSPTTSSSPAGRPSTRRSSPTASATSCMPPLIDNWSTLEDAVDNDIRTLLVAPVITDLEALTLRIDEESQTVLGPRRGVRATRPRATAALRARRRARAGVGSARRLASAARIAATSSGDREAALPGAGAVARRSWASTAAEALGVAGPRRRPEQRAAGGRG